MRRDFSTHILGVDGKPVYKASVTPEQLMRALDHAMAAVPDTWRQVVQTEVTEILGASLTFGAAAAHALTAPAGQEPLPIGEAQTRLELALRLVNGGVVEITPAERDLIKQCASKVFLGAIVPGRLAQLLETEAPAVALTVVP